jgi:membrane protein implicated in regulation of membrane protease activity
MKNLAMISMPHLLILWLLLIVFFLGAFVALVVRWRTAMRERRIEPRKEAQKQTEKERHG